MTEETFPKEQAPRGGTDTQTLPGASARLRVRRRRAGFGVDKPDLECGFSQLIRVCVGQVIKLSEPQFSCQENGCNNTYLTGSLGIIRANMETHKA